MINRITHIHRFSQHQQHTKKKKNRTDIVKVDQREIQKTKKKEKNHRRVLHEQRKRNKINRTRELPTVMTKKCRDVCLTEEEKRKRNKSRSISPRAHINTHTPTQ